MKEFRNRVAVVTGAASGMGKAVAERFAAEGMRVVLADVEPEALAVVEREFRTRGSTVLGVCTDVSKAADVEQLAARTVEAFGTVHVLCNNAGVGTGGLAWLQRIAWCTPLFHGVELVRGLTLNTLDPSSWWIHVAYLLGMTGLGALTALWRFRRRLHA